MTGDQILTMGFCVIIYTLTVLISYIFMYSYKKEMIDGLDLTVVIFLSIFWPICGPMFAAHRAAKKRRISVQGEE